MLVPRKCFPHICVFASAPKLLAIHERARRTESVLVRLSRSSAVIPSHFPEDDVPQRLVQANRKIVGFSHEEIHAAVDRGSAAKEERRGRDAQPRPFAFADSLEEIHHHACKA